MQQKNKFKTKNTERGKWMIEILEFIFQDFWHFVGTVFILETIFGGIRGLVTINK